MDDLKKFADCSRTRAGWGRCQAAGRSRGIRSATLSKGRVSPDPRSPGASRLHARSRFVRQASATAHRGPEARACRVSLSCPRDSSLGCCMKAATPGRPQQRLALGGVALALHVRRRPSDLRDRRRRDAPKDLAQRPLRPAVPPKSRLYSESAMVASNVVRVAPTSSRPCAKPPSVQDRALTGVYSDSIANRMVVQARRRSRR